MIQRRGGGVLQHTRPLQEKFFCHRFFFSKKCFLCFIIKSLTGCSFNLELLIFCELRKFCLASHRKTYSVSRKTYSVSRRTYNVSICHMMFVEGHIYINIYVSRSHITHYCLNSYFFFSSFFGTCPEDMFFSSTDTYLRFS